MLPTVDHADDIRDGDSRLGDVGGDDDLSNSRRRVVEDGGLSLGRDAEEGKGGDLSERFPRVQRTRDEAYLE